MDFKSERTQPEKFKKKKKYGQKNSSFVVPKAHMGIKNFHQFSRNLQKRRKRTLPEQEHHERIEGENWGIEGENRRIASGF